ncbi:MAG: NAD-binding protein [Desulfohalobiaceae bacterium]
MRLLICGAGSVTRELLNRLGKRWKATVIDVGEDALMDLAARHEIVVKTVTGDPSSPVILDRGDLEAQEYVLALCGDDQVNLAVVRFAREKKIRNILARIHDSGLAPEFQELGARVLPGPALLARNIFHYLQNPTVNVTPLASGLGEVLEMEVTPKLWVHDHRVESLHDQGWRVVGIVRDGSLIFPAPEAIVQAGDKLVILGRPDLMQPVCNRMECGLPHFPLSHGGGMLLCLTDADASRQDGVLAEGMHLAQNLQLEQVTVLHEQDSDTVGEQLASWEQSLDLQRRTVSGQVLGHLEEQCRTHRPGLVVIRPFSQSFWKSFITSPLVGLAHTIQRPVLISRNTEPYRRILVPFVASPRAESALEVALDLAGQLDAEVSVVFVDEPEFFHGEDAREHVNSVMRRARKIAHMRQHSLKEIVLEGNPVKEVTREARDFDLMVLGSDTKEKAFFAPHLSELLAQKAPCSVLIITS